MRQPDAAADDLARRSGSGSGSGNSAEKRWLYLTQVGEDAAECLAEADSASEAERSYPFGEYLIVQCATYSDNPADDSQ